VLSSDNAIGMSSDNAIDTIKFTVANIDAAVSKLTSGQSNLT